MGAPPPAPMGAPPPAPMGAPPPAPMGAPPPAPMGGPVAPPPGPAAPPPGPAGPSPADLAKQAAQEKAQAAAAAVASLGITPDKLQGMFADQAKSGPVSLVGKLMFVLGMAIFATFTFMDMRHRTAARQNEAEARAIKAHHWQRPLKPQAPEGPPDPSSGAFNQKWQAERTLDGGGTVIESKVPDDVKENFKKLREDYTANAKKKHILEAMQEYSADMYDFAMANYASAHEKRMEAERLKQEAEEHRYNATVGTLGFYARWLGLVLMFVGMGALAILGSKEESLVALLVMGLGLIWPMVNLGIIR
jgi:hypothetical protein